jgi:hypothetical protein
MNKHKVITTAVMFALAIAAALGTAAPALASHLNLYKVTAGGTIEIGKQGIAFSNVPVGVTQVLAGVTGEDLPPRFNHDVEIDFRPPALEVRFLNANGGYVEDISALVYIFFNIGKAERALWLQGGADEISIWYVNETTGKWAKCPTFFVNENRDNGEYDRLACLAPGSGFYVLGGVGFDEELFTPYTFDGRKVRSLLH